MNTLLIAILIATVLGSGMMAGLFCSFSSFMMKALAERPAAEAIAAMQAINRVIVRPAFLLVFFGTAIGCVASLVFGWSRFPPDAWGFTLAGAVSYIIGSVVVTMLFNVPLNNRLAAINSASESGREMWEIYLRVWTRWNHVRSVATLASTLFLTIAVHRASLPVLP